MTSKKERQKMALQNFKKAWAVFGIHPHEKVVDKYGNYESWEKDPTITPFGGKDPKEGWGLLSS